MKKIRIYIEFFIWFNKIASWFRPYTLASFRSVYVKKLHCFSLEFITLPLNFDYEWLSLSLKLSDCLNVYGKNLVVWKTKALNCERGWVLILMSCYCNLRIATNQKWAKTTCCPCTDKKRLRGGYIALAEHKKTDLVMLNNPMVQTLAFKYICSSQMRC